MTNFQKFLIVAGLFCFAMAYFNAFPLDNQRYVDWLEGKKAICRSEYGWPLVRYVEGVTIIDCMDNEKLLWSENKKEENFK